MLNVYYEVLQRISVTYLCIYTLRLHGKDIKIIFLVSFTIRNGH